MMKENVRTGQESQREAQSEFQRETQLEAERTKRAEPAWPRADGRLNRRELLASLGMTGAAIVSGSLLTGGFANAAGGASVTGAVYGDDCPNAADRNAHFVNVREFGVREDDGNDYTAELQQAIDYAIETGCMLQLNPGKVHISEPGLVIWRSIRIEGARPQVYSFRPSVLSYAGTGTAITFWKKDTANGPFLNDNTAQLANIYFSRVNLQRSFSGDASGSLGYGSYGYGYDFHRTSECRFSECAISGFKVAVHAQGLSITEFEKCDIKRNTYGVWLGAGAEDGSRTFTNSKVAFRDCNFFINHEAHALPGYYQNVFDNCHMESTKRAFYFPMDANNRLIDTLVITKCNVNAGQFSDVFYEGGKADYRNSTVFDISFDATSTIQIENMQVEHCRIRFEGDNTKIIHLAANANSNSSASIHWHNNKVMGMPNGLIVSSSSYQPIVLLSGRNTYKAFNNSNYPATFYPYGTGGKLAGFEGRQGYAQAVSPVRLPDAMGVTTEGALSYDYSSHRLRYRTDQREVFVPRMTAADAAPVSGAYRVSDLVLREPALDGANLGWVCVADNPLLFRPFGQVGYRTSDGPPAVVPYFVGEELLDTANQIWYKAAGTTDADWRQMTGA